MRARLLIVGLAIAGALVLRVAPAAQSVPSVYQTPPKVIADLMDAEPLPIVTLSPDRKVMLIAHRQSMPSIARVSAPFYRLAGSRINPRTNGPRLLSGLTTSLALKDVATGVERKLVLPAAESYSGRFSPDGKQIAVTVTTASSLQLYLADVATGQVKPLLAGGINGLGGGCTWLNDSTGFLCRLIPEGRGPEPKAPAVPTGPAIQEYDGTVAPSATYEDLLKNPYDERLYDYYYTSQLAWVSAAGVKTPFGQPAVYAGASVSTDGHFLTVTRIKKPYSYVVPAGAFPRDVELWDKSGMLVKKLADMPMGDTFPRDGVFPGPRGFRWHPLEPATLIYMEALDHGDPSNKVPFRDRFVALKAPFTGALTEWFEERRESAGGTSVTEKGSVLVSESDRETRMRRTWLLDGGFAAAPRKVWELREQDAYGDPGSPIVRPSNGTVLHVGDAISPQRYRRVTERRPAISRSLQSEDIKGRASVAV